MNCSNRYLSPLSRSLPLLNAAWAAVILSVLCGSLFIQFVIGDLPCRLCMWQRMTMLSIVAVLLINIHFGQNIRNYGIIIVFSVFGSIVSIRQILSYIAPGNSGYGPAVFGLHTYTWAFLVFTCSIVAAAVMLILKSYQDKEERMLPPVLFKGLMGISMLVALTLSFATLFQCGLDVCPGAREYLYGSH